MQVQANVLTALQTSPPPLTCKPYPPFISLQADVCQVTGLPGELVMQVQANILTALGSDTSSLSALRCLKLYLERIGGGEAPQLQKVWA